MARQKQRTPATIYAATVRSALEHFADPVWLGRHSPLASPYFLGEHRLVATRPDAPADRGRILQGIIRQAADRMWGGALPSSRVELAAAVDDERTTLGSKSARYRFFLLELRYLRRYFPPNTFPTTAEAIPGFVNVSPTRFFIHLEEAIDELGQHITERLSPALRLDRPGLARQPVGRDTVAAAAINDLHAARSIAITGQGGVGKTTLGAAVIARWPGVVFWYTFHPGLNDDLHSLLFSLGHFTYAAGAPTLWAQLLANEGQVSSPAQSIGMLRIDLELIAVRQPLLVFDEVDLLQTSAGDPRRKQHSQVLEFLESLREAAPLMLIGQRVYVDTDTHFALEPLPAPESGELLNILGLKTNAVTLHKIQEFTGGNPRLLELYAALRNSGDEASDLLRLPRDSSAQPLFSRLWRRLDPMERELLGALSVFRTYAPRDAWPKMEGVMSDLVHRNLIKIDLGGGVALLPFFRELVYAALPPEKRRSYHLDTARIRAQLGEYTAAAHHYAAGGKPEAAVEVWFAHQEREILAGQAASAGEIFNNIESDALDETHRDRFLVIRNRLALLEGESDRVLEGMEAFTWDADNEVTADALGQLAYAHELRDQADQALAKYDEAINMLSRMATKITSWHMARSLTLAGGADLPAAQHEVQLAMIDIEHLQGLIDYMASRFETAQAHFVTSLNLAVKAGDGNRIANCHYGLAMIAGRQGNIAAANEHAEKAMAHYAETGNRLQLEGMRAELAGMYLNIRQFEEVIEPSEKALRFFERIKHDIWVSTISTNLAEAYMETGRLDKAKEMVFKVLRLEDASNRPYALYTLGHIHDLEGNTAHATTSFREGVELARANGDPFIEAYLRRAFGTLLTRDTPSVEGLEQLTTALEMFTEMGLMHEIEPTAELLRGPVTTGLSD